MDIVALFYDLDKFAIAFERQWKRHLLPDGKRHRQRRDRMHLSEIMTLLILFHASNYRSFAAMFFAASAIPSCGRTGDWCGGSFSGERAQNSQIQIEIFGE
jgi:hypothetical protein